MNLSQDGIFYTLQGEGVHVGVPVIFIRLNHCNMRCEWSDENTGEVTRCDTWYTSWEPEKSVVMTPQEIVTECEQYSCKRISISGGEPMLQKAELIELVHLLKKKGYVINIETNGSVYIEELLNVAFITFSPKLSSSIPDQPVDLKEVHKTMMKRSLKVCKDYIDKGIRKYQFKFVITIPEDFEEVMHFEKNCKINKEKIYLMPEGIDEVALKDRSLWLAEICKQYDYKFTPRLHIALWGNQRGT